MSSPSGGREGGRENHGVCLKRLEVGRPSIITHSLTHSSTASSSAVVMTVLLRRAPTNLPQARRFTQSWDYSRLGFGMRFRCGSCSKQCNSATVQGWLCVQAWYCSGTVVGPRWYPSRCRNLVSHLDCPWPCSAGRQKVEWSGGEGSGVQRNTVHRNGGCDSAILVRNQAAALALSEAEASFFAPSLPFPLRALPCLPSPMSHHPWPWPSPVLPVVPGLPGQAA